MLANLVGRCINLKIGGTGARGVFARSLLS